MTYAEKSCLGLVALLAIVLVVNIPHDVIAEETPIVGGSGQLDGRVFVGEVGRDGQATGRPVQVVSSRSAAGSMVWSGTLDGDRLEGTMRWDHGWESRRYWFRGRSANASASTP